MYNETIQPPETNAQYLGRGRVCQGPSLLGAEFVRGGDVPKSVGRVTRNKTFFFGLSLNSDLYKSDWKLQGKTNTQLKLLCRACYTG